MVENIHEYAAPTPGELFSEEQEKAEIGTIEIGAAQIDTMLKSVSQILNNAIFDIFNSLKLLTTNIQGYFAGGLEEDAKANNAKAAANNIEKKTEKVQKGDFSDTEQQFFAGTTPEQPYANESKQPIVLDKLIEQMLNESFN